MQLFDRYSAEFADLAQVVAPEIDQHIMLGELLFVTQQLRFQRLVLLFCFSSGSGAGEGKGMEHTVLQLD